MVSFHTCHLTLGYTSFCGYSNTPTFLSSLEVFLFPLQKPVQGQIFFLKIAVHETYFQTEQNYFHSIWFLRVLIYFYLLEKIFWQSNTYSATGWRICQVLACPYSLGSTSTQQGHSRGTFQMGIALSLKEGVETKLCFTVTTNIFTPKGLSFTVYKKENVSFSAFPN